MSAGVLDRRGAVRAVGWTAAARLGTTVLQFVAGLALARLLTPTDFGTVASVLVLSGFAVLLVEMGMGAALVQLRDLREEDLATVFWCNALGGLLLAGALTAAAPAIAAFFDRPVLEQLTPLVALAFALNLGVCQIALLQRELRFKALATVELGVSVLGLSVAVGAAVAGAGVFSLVLGPVVQAVAGTIALWVLRPWRPRHFVVVASWRRMWGFTSGMLGFNAVNYWSRNSDNLMLGRVAGAEVLGYYNRAYNLMLLPVSQISQVAGRVMFPALSAVADDHARVRSAYRSAVRAGTALCAPALVGMAATAPALVPVLWGPGWGPTVPLLQLLCLAGVPQCLGTSVGWLYQSQGRTRELFRMSLLFSVLVVISFAIGLRWGATGVATAWLLHSWLTLPLSLRVAGRSVGLSARRVLADSAPTLLVAAVMGLVVLAVPLVAAASPVETLAVQVLLGVVVTAGGLRLVQPGLWQEVRALRSGTVG